MIWRAKTCYSLQYKTSVLDQYIVFGGIISILFINTQGAMSPKNILHKVAIHLYNTYINTYVEENEIRTYLEKR
jgi:hypothetical protein